MLLLVNQMLENMQTILFNLLYNSHSKEYLVRRREGFVLTNGYTEAIMEAGAPSLQMET